MEYNNYHKPTMLKNGTVHDGNLGRGEDTFDSVTMFVTGHSQSFNGFSGTTEFEGFPLRQLFLNNHKCFPSEWDTGYIKSEDIEKYISENENKIIATHYFKNKEVSRCLLYLGGEECVYVYLYGRGYDKEDHYGVCLLFTKKTKRVEGLMDYFIGLIMPKEEKNEGFLNILVKTNYGFSLEKKEIFCPDIDFDVNYNKDFKSIHELIIEKLSVDNSKGLVLLHGMAGTGKTTYIRYLINNLKKKVIYIPPSMANYIADPELIKFFIKHSNSILVIEDAENILMKRVASSTQAIANILNLSDGLLSDCANIQIVATFNTDILNIDSALLRKGRLIAKYEFKALEESRAVKLGEKLGVKINGANTLADVYSSNEKSFNKKESKIGFKQ